MSAGGGQGLGKGRCRNAHPPLTMFTPCPLAPACPAEKPAGLFPEGLPAGKAHAHVPTLAQPAAEPAAAAAASTPAPARAIAAADGPASPQHAPARPVTIHVAEERLEWLFPNFDCCAFIDAQPAPAPLQSRKKRQ